jgi:hypothetical protein
LAQFRLTAKAAGVNNVDDGCLAMSCERLFRSQLSIFRVYRSPIVEATVSMKETRSILVAESVIMNEIDKSSRTAQQPNEGEGNRTAARAYNESAKRFAQSGKVEKKAREAQQAVDGDEAKELARAEATGRGHSAGEDHPKPKSS